MATEAALERSDANRVNYRLLEQHSTHLFIGMRLLMSRRQFMDAWAIRIRRPRGL